MPDPLAALAALPGWIETAVALDPRLGYLALGLAMLLENLIPPIPSELIQPLGGLLVQRGALALLPVILVGTAGSVLGAWFWYGVGRWIGDERLLTLLGRHGGWLGISDEDLSRSRAWFARHGLLLVFGGRLLPGIRTLISLPAGLEAMAQGPFLLATTAGSLLWVIALTLAGQALGAGTSQLLSLAGPYAEVSRLLLLSLVAVLPVRLLLRMRRQQTPPG